MALDMQHLDFFCSEEHAGNRVAMAFRNRRYGLLHWVYFYECPSCGSVAKAYMSKGRLRIDQNVERATRRNQKKRA